MKLLVHYLYFAPVYTYVRHAVGSNLQAAAQFEEP